MEPYNGFQTMCIKFQNSTLQMIVLYLFMSNQVDFNKIQWFSLILSLLEKKNARELHLFMVLVVCICVLMLHSS